MRSFIAFTKKELTEHIRSGKLTLFGIIFLLIGVMNPAIAKLTPWMYELLADSLAGTGIEITNVTVTALDSWVQFYKNIPMGLIAFVIIESSIFTKEYSSGTLTLALTKGLARYKVVASKGAVLLSLWTICYFLSYVVTYLYNSFYWDNSIAKNLSFSALCYWIFGIFALSLVIFFSSIANTNSGVLIGCGGVIFGSFLVSLIPKVNKYLPTLLSDGVSLIYGTEGVKFYTPSLIITSVLIIIAISATIPLFNKKQLK